MHGLPARERGMHKVVDDGAGSGACFGFRVWILCVDRMASKKLLDTEISPHKRTAFRAKFISCLGLDTLMRQY
jgi:hypothetical protein